MVGHTLGHYRILELLGKGGMGEVYRAEDTTLKRQVALKVLPAELASSQERLERFQREAETLAALDHPNIVHIYTVEEADDSHFLTMQLVEGKTLSGLIPKGGMQLERFFDIAVPLADALAAAHEKGIIHRDLKPGNIMVTDNGRVKVLDFGLAKLRPEVAPTEATELTTEPLTEAGLILGTVPYMSPEQLEGRDLDSRSDIFALGVILYEMATGERPFRGDSSASLIAAIMAGTPQEVDGLRAELPHHLSRIIRHCLEKDPERRYQAAKDVRNELADLARELEIEEVIKEHADAEVARPTRKRWLPGAVAGAVLSLLVVILIGLNLVKTRSREPDLDAPPRILSLAVLPFDNLMNDPEQDYFVEGMQEALITDLSQIGALRVISRTSTMRYKETRESIPEIARELDVDALIEGSVMRANGVVRVTAQLVHGETDKHLWAESYDRDLEDVLALLTEVARSIASEIEVHVTPEQQQRLAGGAPVDPAAQEAFLKGQYYLTRFSVEHAHRSLELHQQAIELDPTFAPAFAGLANSYLLLGIYGLEPVAEVFPKAKQAALEALELDRLGEAHNALGWISLFFDWNWPEAERAFGRALELNPSHAYANHGYGDYLTVMGRPDEGLAYVERGRQSDPMSPLATLSVAGHLLMARRFDDAIAECTRLLELGPEFSEARWYLASALWHQGLKPEALTMFQDRWKEDPELLEAFDRGLEQSGAEGALRSVAQAQVARLYSDPVDPLDVASLFALAGDVDSAFEWLEEAYQQRRPLILLKADPDFDALRSDPRFDDLARRIGLPE